MNIYINLENAVSSQVADTLGMTLVFNPEQADVTLIFLSDIIPEIKDAVHSGYIAGPYTSAALNQSRELVKGGIPPENIIFTPTSQITTEIIRNLVTRIKPTSIDVKPRRIPRIIGVVSCKGGVGKTTIAAALVNHYNGFNQPAILIDWCTPPNGKFHTDLVIEDQSLDFGSEKLSEYMRIVVDVPAGFTNYSLFDCLIAVTSADIVQSVQPLREVSAEIVVYNRISKQVKPEIINQALNVDTISIEDDFMGCQAGLVKHAAANVTSQAIAVGIGKIASIIDEGRSSDAKNIRSRSA